MQTHYQCRYFIFKLNFLFKLICLLLFHFIIFAHDILYAEIQAKRVVNFEWEVSIGANSYQIEVLPISKSEDSVKKPYTFNTSKPIFNGSLNPGRYKIRLRSEDARGVPGDWSNYHELIVPLEYPDKIQPSKEAILNTEAEQESEVNIQWQSVPFAKTYKIQIMDEKKTLIREEETSVSAIKIKLKVAKKYFWHVRSYSIHKDQGDDKDDLWAFTLVGKALAKTNIVRPENEFVRKIKWSEVEFAEKYKLNLWQLKKNNQWEPVLTDKTLAEAQFDFPLDYAGGKYKISIVAQAKMRADSSEASLVFNVLNGNRSEEEEERLLVLQSINRSEGWYFIASYLLTQITYTSTNYDTFVSPQYKVLGGVGRIGMGYLRPRSPWGYLVITDLSGFFIDQKNHTYSSTEAHVIYRDNRFADGELRYSTGVFAKSLPIITSSQSVTGNSQFAQLQAGGPHVGIEYLRAFSPKLGMQLNARAYSSLFGKTPNNLPIDPALSFQLGLMGSYRFSYRQTGLTGLALRRDAIQYKTTNEEILGNKYVNEAKIQGLYVNFIYEYVF